MDDLPTVPARTRRFERLAYGLFLHYGLYSLLRRGEWTRHHHRLDTAAYERLTRQFAAEAWDAPALVAWARNAGFRYLCLTSRHHDGFSLYDTRGLNRFDAPHSAARRDLVRELADACHALRFPLFLYHTTLDWRHPAFDRDWDAYQRYLRESVEILCTRYGAIAGFWFDGNWSRPERDWQEDALYAVIRRHQPQAIIVNNSSVNARGRRGHPEVDVLTFEQGAPVAAAGERGGKYLAREMCETMTSHWGNAAEGDFSAKSPAQVIATLALCRRHGANLLLNVGPEASGRLPAYERAALEVVGSWIRRQPGDALYRGSPDGRLCCRGRDFVLREGRRLLYFAHDLGITENVHLGGEQRGLRTVQGLVEPVRGVRWRDTGEALHFSQDVTRGMLTLDLTPNPYGAQAVVRVAEIQLLSGRQTRSV